MGYLLATMITLLAASPSPDAVRRAVQSELSDKGYQRDLPSIEQDGSGFRRQPRGRMVSRGGKGGGGGHATPPPVSSATRMVASTTLWVIILACGAVVLFMIGRVLFTPRKRKARGANDVVVHDAVTTKPLGDARRLAESGRYAEAIHALLLRTLHELSHVAPEPVPASLTSREILARVALPEAARSALSGLIDAVEITHFGGRAPDESGYRMCLDRFDEFARSYTGAAA